MSKTIKNRNELDRITERINDLKNRYSSSTKSAMWTNNIIPKKETQSHARNKTYIQPQQVSARPHSIKTQRMLDQKENYLEENMNSRPPLYFNSETQFTSEYKNY